MGRITRSVIIHDEDSNPMQLITCNLPKADLKLIEVFIHKTAIEDNGNNKIFPSRSEFIRTAVREYIEKRLSLKPERDKLIEYYNSKIIRRLEF